MLYVVYNVDCWIISLTLDGTVRFMSSVWLLSDLQVDYSSNGLLRYSSVPNCMSQSYSMVSECEIVYLLIIL